MAAPDATVAALDAAAPTTGVPVGPRSQSAASMFRADGGYIPPGSDVDHTIDLQLGGADSIENMSPLDRSVNRSLGAQLNHVIRSLPPGARLDSFSIGN